MRATRSAAALMILVLLPSCAQPYKPAIDATEVSSRASLSTPDYYYAVTSLHSYQIRSAELAIQRSRTPFHVKFAREISATHSSILAELRAAGKPAGLTPARTLHPAHQRWLNDLVTSEDPVLFDAWYPRNQGTALETAKRLHGAYALYGDNVALRRIAERTMRLTERQEHAMRMRPLGPTR